MSGMEPLIAFSLACNVMQVISFGHDTVSACKLVYQSGSPLSHSSLDEATRLLTELLSSLTHELKKLPMPLNRGDMLLADVARKCTEAMRDLRDEVNFLTENRKDILSVLRVATKAAWRKRRLERLEKNLGDWRQIMETSILAQLSLKAQTSAIEQQEGFDRLDTQLQSFIRQLATSHMSLSHLVACESQGVKGHVTREVAQVAESVKAHVTAEGAIYEQSLKEHITSEATGVHVGLSDKMEQLDIEADRERIRERFLKSLKFQEMNGRRNQIPDSFPRTYYWILDIDPDDAAMDSDGSSRTTADAHSSDEDSADEWTSSSFIKWLESDDKLFWISGKPGSGKSTLMKFIVSRRETQESLNEWRRDPRIIAHYLWGAGTTMQRSLGGILFSLLYQAVEISKTTVDTILSRHIELRSKDSVSDWALPELRSLLVEVLQGSAQPLCIFLDGLDEICPEDGPDKVLALVEALQQIPHVKLCVSSRPEPAFQRRLGGLPSIKIHELTASDLRLYTESVLSEPLSCHLNDWRYRHLVHTILNKAEGVFLWVVLVVRSLCRGLDNGDGLDELNKRVAMTPRDLYKLFESMWQRLGDDEEIYARTAALYFQLVLASFDDTFREHMSNHGSISVLDLALAVDVSLQQRLCKQSRDLATNEIEKMCVVVSGDIANRCAGLLEVIHMDGKSPSHVFGSVMKYADWRVKFIHRSVIDFLLSESKGQELLVTYNLPRVEALIRIIVAYAIHLRLDEETQSRTVAFPGRHFETTVVSWMDAAAKSESIPSESIHGLICLCQSWVDLGHITFEKTITIQAGEAAIFKPSMFDLVYGTWVMAHTRKHFEIAARTVTLDAKHLSHLLQAVCVKVGHVGESNYSWYIAAVAESIESLLGRGADPDQRGANFIFDHTGKRLAVYLSSFQLALLSIVSLLYDTTKLEFDDSSHQRIRNGALRILNAFKEAKADLTGKVCIALCIGSLFKSDPVGIFLEVFPSRSSVSDGVLLEIDVGWLLRWALDKLATGIMCASIENPAAKFIRVAMIACNGDPEKKVSAEDEECLLEELAGLCDGAGVERVEDGLLALQRLQDIYDRSPVIEGGLDGYLDELGYRPSRRELEDWNNYPPFPICGYDTYRRSIWGPHSDEGSKQAGL